MATLTSTSWRSLLIEILRCIRWEKKLAVKEVLERSRTKYNTEWKLTSSTKNDPSNTRTSYKVVQMTIESQPTMMIAEPAQEWPVTLPISIEQYEVMVERGDFDKIVGQVELMNGRIVQMNPQGPKHCDPIDYLTEWSIRQSNGDFTIRIEKPIRIPDRHSCPEPDVTWVTRRRYIDRHPVSEEVYLLIEVSYSSVKFDRTEKQQLYAASKISEYWRVDVPSQAVFVHREPIDSDYTSIQRFDKGQTIHPLCLPLASLDIASLFVDQLA